ncbi:helix-turn-helix domain-containing protein [Streptomyces sp. NPDC001380]|uniref:helix-turn-helix domain-containing protein n=1 Tax=Streptomyces sp. NPDC001380 TaxID=3364566 RepID=UPI0036A862B9
MTQEEWGVQLTALIAEQVRRLRRERGMSAQDLSDACAALGFAIPRAVFSNLETGRRASLEVAELLVVAKALDVPPLALLFPLSEHATVEALPGQVLPTWDALAWFTGTEHLDTPAPAGSARAVLDAFREHAETVQVALASHRLAGERRRRAAAAADPRRGTAHTAAAEQFAQLAAEDLRQLHTLREEMQAQGLPLPALPHPLDSADLSRGTDKG